MQDWLRNEWKRTGLPFSEANTACGVKNAATRKYLTGDHLWYMPPADMFQKLVDYANQNGDKNGKPYFSMNGINPIKKSQWECLRNKFYCPFGITNVWDTPQLRDKERIKIGNKAIHLNQKPLALLDQIILASSDENDLIWDPFGGLFSTAISAYMLGRDCCSAEIDINTYRHGISRFEAITGVKITHQNT
jgi:site-specific DNA-methyltransferase (adenine-specific)